MQSQPWVMPIIIFLIVLVYFIGPRAKQRLCFNNDFSGLLSRLLVHNSLWHMLFNIWGLIELYELEKLIGAWRLLGLIIVLVLLSTFIQRYTTYPVEEYRIEVEQIPILQKVQSFTSNQVEGDCTSGFSGIVLALQIVLFYILAEGGIKTTWLQMRVLFIQMIPALLLANITLHGQVSGLLAGLLLILSIDIGRKFFLT